MCVHHLFYFIQKTDKKVIQVTETLGLLCHIQIKQFGGMQCLQVCAKLARVSLCGKVHQDILCSCITE